MIEKIMVNEVIRSLEWRQRNHYARVSHQYSSRRATVSGVQINRYLDRKIAAIANWRDVNIVLLLGCGSYKIVGVNENKSKIIALDISIDMLRIFSRDYPDTPVVQASGFALPFRDQSLPYIVARGSLHHMPELLSALREIRRSLGLGGRLVFLEPFDDWIVWRAIRGVVYAVSTSLDAQSEKTLRRQELLRLLHIAELELEASQSSGLFTFLFLRNDDISLIARMFTSKKVFPIIFRIAQHIDRIVERIFEKSSWIFPEVIGVVVRK